MVFLKQFLKKVDFEKNQLTTKSLQNYPGGKNLIELCRHWWDANYCISSGSTLFARIFSDTGQFYMLFSIIDKKFDTQQNLFQQNYKSMEIIWWKYFDYG